MEPEGLGRVGVGVGVGGGRAAITARGKASGPRAPLVLITRGHLPAGATFSPRRSR